jgi:hypothetical protein
VRNELLKSSEQAYKCASLRKEENKNPGSQGGPMTSIANSSVSIQASARSVPSPPPWLGEVTLIAHYLKHQGVLVAIEEQVRFARRRGLSL